MVVVIVSTAVKDYEELNDEDKELQCPKIIIKNPSTILTEVSKAINRTLEST
jgi:hypothetical protein